MKLKTRIIAFVLMLLTVFYAIPVSTFAKVAFSEKSGKKSESSSTEVQASEKDATGIDSPDQTEKFNYWSANIMGGVIMPIRPLTYSEARQLVAEEKDIVCRDHASAIAIVKFYPSAIWESAHGGGVKCGCLNHYHLSNEHKNHIWYYGD